jgi:hypothetical protein
MALTERTKTAESSCMSVAPPTYNKALVPGIRPLVLLIRVRNGEAIPVQA